MDEVRERRQKIGKRSRTQGAPAPFKLITLTSDFGKQTQGVGTMEVVAYEICPDAKVVHLMHGIPDFDITTGARTLETVRSFQPGNHVCVVDPGVGTPRRGIIIKTKRGDHLIGPDNGVLLPTAKILGIEKIVQITNPRYMRQPVSPIFHGRDVFTPAAAHLAAGVAIESFGRELHENELTNQPYHEAKVKTIGKKRCIPCEVICINKFGSVHLNILAEEWDKFNSPTNPSCLAILHNNKKEMILPITVTFGDVPSGSPLIMKDDYGRVEIAINCGRFADEYQLQVKDKVTLQTG